jgi:hypothetical protein
VATAHTIDLTHERTRLDELGPRLFTLSFLIGLIGMVVSIGLTWMAGDEMDRAFKSYLHNFIFVLSLALGGLFFTFLQHLTRAGWSVAIRRPAEAAASNLSWLWILFVPIATLFFIEGRRTALFPWADLEWLTQHNAGEAHLVEKKAGYLNVNFFLVRAAIYFAVWFLLSRFFFKNSLLQDRTGDPRLSRRMQTLSAPAAILFALTITFAAVDWMMSLSPAWFSTMFGVYFFAGLCTGFFALNIIIVLYLQSKGRLVNVVTSEHLQDMGKLLFAFGIVFWAYIAFSQYMLIWYANLPAETGWFMPRYIHGWAGVSWALLFGHFVIPFLVLISRHAKRLRPMMLLGAVWMLALHWLDLYWLIMPEIPAQLSDPNLGLRTLSDLARATTPADVNYGWKLYDFTWLIGLLGLFIAGTVRAVRDQELIPVRDPRLHESLAFENM